jgi:hypothetical protein
VILSGCVWGTKIGARTEKSTVCRRDADFGTPHDQDSYFSHHYHTTLVSVIAACLRSRRLKERAPQPPRATTSVREAPPRLERRLDAARAAGSWLGRLTDDVLSEAGPQAGLLSQLLLGIWAAAALAGAGLNTVATEVRRIGRRLAERDALNDLSWADTSATQSLLVARVLEHYEIVVPYLHASDGFVARAVQTLEVTDDPALNEPRIVLQNAGRLPESPCPGAGEVVAHAEGLRLGADPEEIDALVDRVEAHTAFATRPSQLRPRDGWTAEVLAGVAVYCLRRYDFIRGTRLHRKDERGGAARPGVRKDRRLGTRLGVRSLAGILAGQGSPAYRAFQACPERRWPYSAYRGSGRPLRPHLGTFRARPRSCRSDR